MTLSWWEGMIFGLVQGLTEFLPISSSGHLVLAEGILGFSPPGLWFEVGLHVATLLSVVIAYGSRIRFLIGGILTRDREAWRYVLLLGLASIPAALVGLLLRDRIVGTFQPGIWLGASFLLTAVILWSTRATTGRATSGRITTGSALAMGCAQALAILPAVSRSGTTIAAGLWARVAPAEAAEFSFLMSIIAVAGSGLLEIRHLPAGVNLLDAGFLAAFAAALVSGVLAIRFLVMLLRGRRFHLFAVYCAALGVGTILWHAVLRP